MGQRPPLQLGAVEVICKPGSQYSTPDVRTELAHAIRVAALSRPPMHQQAEPPAGDIPDVRPACNDMITANKVLAIGASTGGTKAIETVLIGLPATAPGTVIVQHMPAHFTAAFAARLNSLCKMQVREACDNDSVVPGVALLAPGNKHMVLQKSGACYLVRLKDGPAVHHQRPSVDVLFHSVARNAGRNAVGVILTGMGADGAEGLLAMRNNGARTIAQDEHTCVVFGMPKEAIKMGAAEQIVPLPDVACTALAMLSADCTLATA